MAYANRPVPPLSGALMKRDDGMAMYRTCTADKIWLQAMRVARILWGHIIFVALLSVIKGTDRVIMCGFMTPFVS